MQSVTAPIAPSTVAGGRGRTRIEIAGAVQGVGFRPFVYRLAAELGLVGWVTNTAQGVVVEAEGPRERIGVFSRLLESDAPPFARIDRADQRELAATGETSFVIRNAEAGGRQTATVLPDLATCDDCLAEIFDESDRRYMYPFTNCTNCGPRYSIIERLPYDRANTTMARFALCAACRAEYEDPLDRRFHAQPTACRVCGPTLELWNGSGQALGRGHEALTLAAARIRSGEILALKGLGGFHLMADASNEQAIARLRERKHRPHRPFAIMAPDLATANELCIVSELERRLLTSVEAPIVLLRRRRDLGDARVRVSAGTAPDNPYLGVMLPYTPLHHLLMGEVGAPIIATSANLSGDPMVTDEADVCARLHGIADCFLVHDRPIARAVDDSVVRVIAGRETVLRAARGYAPVALPMASPAPDVLATGGHLKSAIAIVRDRHIFLGPHIGDLQSERSRSALRHCTAAMGAFYDLRPAAVACDRHPDYFTTDYAKAQARRVITVPHHAAHVLACLADNAIEGPVLGVAWDGGGFGDDGTVWGGEFLHTDGVSFRRVAHFQPFSLPGGERAIREPRRSALGLLWEALGDAALDRSDLAVVASFSSAELSVRPDT